MVLMEASAQAWILNLLAGACRQWMAVVQTGGNSNFSKLMVSIL